MRRRGLLCGFLLGLVLLAGVLAPRVRAAEPNLDAALPVDPNVQMAELPNGLECWMRHNERPPDRVSIWLHVGSGSINEEDDQRGLAHFLEHMAFRGSENFPPGTLIKYFESIGLTFGEHQNAFTGFDQTTYVLTLPDTKQQTIVKGLLCMSDFACGLTLPSEELARERGVILEEFRARKGPDQRMLEKLLPVLLPGSRVAERLPIGKEEVVEKAEHDDLGGYYRTWYRPDDSALLVVGDVDPQETQGTIATAFQGWEAVPNPKADADAEVKPYAETRAAVITDPELTTASASVVAVRPLEKLLTVGDFRSRLVDNLGMLIVNRRLDEMVQKGTAPFQGASLMKTPLWNVCTYIEAEATGQPDKWAPMLSSVMTELKRARQFGFLEQEFEDARKLTLASAEEAAQVEPTRSAQSFLNYMNNCVSRDNKPMSADQKLELTRELIDGVSLDEVYAAYKGNFDASARLLLVAMPEKEDLDVPSEEEILAVGKEAEATEVEPPVAKQRPESLLEREPAPGAVAEQEEEPDLEVLSVTLQNGVRAHLRHMDYKKDQVLARITLAGGSIRETAQDRAVTSVAALVLGQPASGKLSSTQIRDLMTGKKVNVAGSAGSDTLTISIEGTPEDVEEGFRLAHLLLTEPKVEASALKVWKEQMDQEIERRKTNVEAHLWESADALTSGGDPRFEFPTREQVEARTLEQGQAWLDGIVRAAPIEAAVVGDIDRQRALELVLKYLGSLPTRPATDPSLEPLRKVAQNPGPLLATAEVETITPRAVVLVGWRGADWRDVKDRRVLQLAAQIMETRLREGIREQRSLTYSIFCQAKPGIAYPGTGLFFAYFTADPDKAAEAADLTRSMIQQFAQEGPTAEEMDVVHRQFANEIETSQKEPGYWASVLSDLDYHGTKLADVKEALEMYTSYTREDVMEVLGKYLTDERRVQVIALPKQTAQAPEQEVPAEATVE